MNVTDIMERFVEVVRQFPFLYDKTCPEFTDKRAKMNRWDIIGSKFALSGECFRPFVIAHGIPFNALLMLSYILHAIKPR